MVLKDKVAIVTGAGSGIGKAIALRFAREGASVVVAGRTLAKVEQTAQEMEEIGARSLALRADVSVAADVADMVKRTIDELGGIDILVNNAGIVVVKNFSELTEEDWDKTMAIDLKGPFLCCKQVVPVMMAGGKGKIINIASTSGHIGFRVCYGAAKAGLINFTFSLARELAPYKINVNAISPGRIQTPLITAPGAPPQSQPTEERALKCIPYGRLGQPEDIASAATFLASDESEYIVGSVIVVDGGWLNTFNCFG